MKIGILGNMNNMYFSLARFLADEGYDCELMLYDYEPAHFHPTADTFREQLNFRIRQLNWGDPAHFFKNRHIVSKDLESFDFLIGNGTAPAFLHRIGRVLDLFMPYGDDLYALPFPRLVHPFRQIPYLSMAWHQRRGIRECPFILFDKANPAFEKVFERLDYRGTRIMMPPPLFYYREYQENGAGHNNPFAQQLSDLRRQNDLLVVQHIRQLWKTGGDQWNLKGNDQLIRGYALFLQQHPDYKSQLVLFEYGTDVDETKKLIAELGISHAVTWLPKMQRKYLVDFIRSSDVVVGELFHSWNSYCVVAETLAFGKVLLHKRTDADFRDVYEKLYPMIHASSAASVAEGLLRVASDKNSMERMGQEGKAWFLEYCVQKPLGVIRELIQRKEALHA